MNEEINDVCEYPIIWFVCGLIFGNDGVLARLVFSASLR